MTIYARLGDWLIALLALLALAYIVLFTITERENRVTAISTELIRVKRRRGRPRKDEIHP